MKEEFLNAVIEGDVAKVREMLKADATLAQAKDEKGVSAIIKGVYYGKKEVVATLLASGVELNIFEASATGQTERARSGQTRRVAGQRFLIGRVHAARPGCLLRS